MSIRNSLSVLILLLLFSSISLVIAQEAKTGELAEKKMLTVEDVNRLAFAGFMRAPRGIKWLPDGRYFTHVKTDRKTRSQQLWRMDSKTGKEVQILSSDDLKSAEDEKAPTLTGYTWEPDGKGIVLKNDTMIQRYRFNTKEFETIYSDAEKIELLQQAPTGQHFAFVKNGDLYSVNLKGEVTRLTQDGNETVLNGKLDWVYQEELVGRGQFSAYFWSPDGKHIAYLQFDQTPVPHYPLVDWEPYQAKAEMMRYPKAGDPNSIVKLGVVSVNGGETTWLDSNAESDDYYPRVYWLPSSDEVAYFRLDRRQQNLEFVFAKANGSDKRVVIKESDEHWINVEDYVHFLKNKKQFIWGSERSGYNHLYLYDYNGKQKKQLTSGDWFVDKLSAVNEKRGEVYFTSTKDDIRERHLYRVKLNGKSLKKLTRIAGMHRINMDDAGEYYIDSYSNLTTSTEMRVYNRDGKLSQTLLEDDNMIENTYQLASAELFTFEGDNELTYYAKIIKPSDFDASKKYPVLVYTYGGPHAQVIQNNGRRNLWHHMLAQKGYIVFSMDNRGAAGRGHDWETPIYKNMGKIELEDQLRGVDWLKSQSYVDSSRIGIWGWSYGGYMTLYAMTNSDAFAAGISVAPVTDWRNYDTAYTERYMGLPSENEEGYKVSAPSHTAENLSGRLFLVHGTGDDNVHMQNAIHMADKLIDAGIDFDMMFYPNQKHGIRNDRNHLFKKMTSFLEQYLPVNVD